MAELVPAPFADLVARLYDEPRTNDTLFTLPRKRWFLPDPAAPDLTVRFQGGRAGNPLGPAAGPHTQMAQNLLLSYVAGSRILELKTVQVNDRLIIGRPCIDMTNVGYNIEWSQELRVEDSLREYVAGAMLIEIFRRDPEFASGRSNAALPWSGPAGDLIYDLSVGYDLAGIRSDKVQRFLDGMRDASAVIERLRGEIPTDFKLARELPCDPRISDTLTLSTFHGCPADEIERICEFLIAERELDVIVKMNPPMLGRERLEHLLHEVLGYTELQVNPKAYSSGLRFDESIELTQRLARFAAARGRRFGCKFSNTLEVLNHRTFFTPDNEIQYLSGQPLHVLTMTLTDVFRQAVGPHVPISFSAGIDRLNFPAVVACGLVPVTVSTDLLRPGGYGRLPPYLRGLEQQMRTVGAANIDAYILNAYGQENEARGRADSGSAAASRGTADDAAVRWAGLLNTSIVAAQARDDPRYRAARNRAVPKRMNSHLVTFDCITCDKCLPVCPNAANFTYPTPVVAFDYHDVIVAPSGDMRLGPTKRFEIKEPMQIACYADFCNECGNCDTFCPEYGGPYIKKPSFYGTLESWRRAAPRDGFVVRGQGPSPGIRGRMQGAEYELIAADDHRYCYRDAIVEATLSSVNHAVTAVRPFLPLATEHTVDLGVYHTLRHLLRGVLDPRFVHQVNAAVRHG